MEVMVFATSVQSHEQVKTTGGSDKYTRGKGQLEFCAG